MASEWLRSRKARNRMAPAESSHWVYPEVSASGQWLSAARLQLDERPGGAPDRKQSMLSNIDGMNKAESFATFGIDPESRRVSRAYEAKSRGSKVVIGIGRQSRRWTHVEAVDDEEGLPFMVSVISGGSSRRASFHSGDGSRMSFHSSWPRASVRHRRSTNRRLSNRRYSARRMSRLASVMKSPEELSLNPVSAGGMLFDLILRHMSAKGAPGLKDAAVKELFQLCNKEIVLEYDEGHRYHEAVFILLKEALVCQIMRVLAPELKTRKKGGWPATRPQIMVEAARKALKYSRECKCLDAEVTNWRMSFTLLHKTVYETEDPATKFHKTGKVVAFWLDYHGRKWDSGGATPEGSSSPSSRGRSASGTATGHGTMTQSASLPCLGSTDSPELPGGAGGSGALRLPPLFGSPLGPAGHGQSFESLLSTSSRPAGLRRQHSRIGLPSSKDLPPVVARKRYLGACERGFITPKPLNFVTGHSTKLIAANRNLLDRDLLAITEMLQATAIEEVDLHGSTSVSDKSLVPFLGGLIRGPAVKSLRRLSLKQCARASLGSQQMIVQALGAIEGLRHLDLSGVPIARKYQLPLCEAIRDHGYLESANLSDIGLGHSARTKDCIGALGNSKLRTLDIGWNCFNSEEFVCLVEKLKDNDFISSLSLCNSSAKMEGLESPLSFFLEHVGRVAPLRRLDLSLNGIDYQSALILEDTLEHNKNLTHLDLSGSALGVLGMRSMLRLLCQGKTSLMHFDADESYLGITPTGDTLLIFSATNPGGCYGLDLARPYHRSFLRMLYKSCERFRVPPNEAFIIVDSQPRFHHAAKDKEGVWEVPTEGWVTLTFNMERVLDSAVKGVGDEDFSGFLRRHYEQTRLRPAFNKIGPLMARWRELSEREFEQEVFLNALSKDFYLTLADVTVMCWSARPRTDVIISTLLPSIPSDSVTEYLTGTIYPSVTQFIATQLRIRQMQDFNANNPTGHYSFNLGNSADFCVAGHLLLLDRWEALVDRRRHRFDISARGNRSHLRNEQYRCQPLETFSAEWRLPEVDSFEFDYVSSVRPPEKAEVLGEETFNDLLTEISDSTAAPAGKISALRAASHYIYLNSFMMRSMLGIFKTKEERAEAFVIFYLRIVDMYNAKVFRVRFGSGEEIAKLQARLGYASFFPFIQPENYRFELDLFYHDQRLCCSLLVALAWREKEANLRQPRYILADGTEDPLPQGVPRSWETLEKVPTSGVFSASYVCAPEDRQFDVRKSFAAKYGYFRTNVPEISVLWWTGLDEPPPDVIILLNFLFNNVGSSEKAFNRIDVEGNSLINLRMLEDGLREMGCKKFQKQSEKDEEEDERIEAIFRYLDPGGEGSVSRYEWEVVSQLWNEYETSVCEFVQFLVRTFGDDLEDAWEALVEDQRKKRYPPPGDDSDEEENEQLAEQRRQAEQQREEEEDEEEELSLEQFIEAVEHLGYFGPTRIVFQMLDSNDNGDISMDEFEVLSKYKKLPNLTRRNATPTSGRLA